MVSWKGDRLNAVGDTDEFLSYVDWPNAPRLGPVSPIKSDERDDPYNDLVLGHVQQRDSCCL